jgi:hypothetical protein
VCVQTPLPSGTNLSILARVYDRFDGVNQYAVRRINVTTCSSRVLLSLLRGALTTLQSGSSLNDTQFYRALIIASGEGKGFASRSMHHLFSCVVNT